VSWLRSLFRGRRSEADTRAEMPFLDHLEELRWRIFKVFGAVLLGTVAGLILVLEFEAIELLLRPMCAVVERLDPEEAARFSPASAVTECELVFLNLTEPFFFVLKLGILSGLVLASPVVIYQVWAFLSPALEKHERQVIIPSLFLGLVLFLVGVAFAYFAALPITINFLLLFGVEHGFQPMLTAQYYLSLVIRLLLVFGIIFELPVVVMVLASMGLATPEFLREKRRHAIVLIVVIASFLSPGDFILLTVMLTVPLILLYELSILLARVVYRKRERSILGPSRAEGTVEADR